VHRLQDICGVYWPNVVYHAAAYKPVPLVESNPMEGVFNNVFGTLNMEGLHVFVVPRILSWCRPTKPCAQQRHGRDQTHV